MTSRGEFPLSLEEISASLERAIANTQWTTCGRHFQILEDRRLTAEALRGALARIHQSVVQHRFRQRALELWLKRARMYGTTYAILHDLARNYEAAFAVFAAQQHREVKPCLTFSELKEEVQTKCIELGKLQLLVGRLQAERDSADDLEVENET